MRTKIILAALLLLILNSCSRKWRCDRIVAKAERLGCISFKNDTFTVHDTVPGFSADTVFKTDSIKNTDTFTFIKDNIKVVTVVKYKEKIVTQNITRRDTVFTKKYFKVTPVKTIHYSIGYWLRLCFFVLFLFWLLSLYVSYKKNPY